MKVFSVNASNASNAIIFAIAAHTKDEAELVARLHAGGDIEIFATVEVGEVSQTKYAFVINSMTISINKKVVNIHNKYHCYPIRRKE